MEFNIDVLNQLISKQQNIRDYLSGINASDNKQYKLIIHNAAKPAFISSISHNTKYPIFMITSTHEKAKNFFDQIANWSHAVDASILPELDVLPYQKGIPDPAITHERIKILDNLLNRGQDDKTPILIASMHSVIQNIIEAREYVINSYHVKKGQKVNPIELYGICQSIGYRTSDVVENTGFISRRGDIFDIFPPPSDRPLRIELFGNEVESIRFFDPDNQRSMDKIEEVIITPTNDLISSNRSLERYASTLKSLDFTNCKREVKDQMEHEIEMFLSGQRPQKQSLFSNILNKGSIIDYLTEETLIIIEDKKVIESEFNHIDAEYLRLKNEKIENGEIPQDIPAFYHDWNNLYKKMIGFKLLDMISWSSGKFNDIVKLHFYPAPVYAGNLDKFIKKAIDFKRQGKRVIIISNQAVRLSELFEDEEEIARVVDILRDIPPLSSITIIQGSLSEGWTLDDTYLFTDKEIFGFVKERRYLKKRAAHKHTQLTDIKQGDFVVHVEHGIAVFSGITMLDTNNARKEYLLLSYADGDKLYVPTEQIDRISKYIGAGESKPRLSRLGTQEWNHVKKRVKESVTEIAHDLLQLYSARQLISGFSFSEDTPWQRELEGSFPYIETPDQVKVMNVVKFDMTDHKPMDRLIIGDVGYGKTEIAVRAAFKAVMDNKQVAMLVPTTVLAEQHYQTFTQRMAPFPVNIEVLSRFRHPSKQKAIINDISDGKVDICIGTHRIIQEDVNFKNLGLLIIDEEQRFGVYHKEYLKKMRQQVDVLTLSATPIPRTLHMSLVGVRDMSLIETPPEDRLPINTYIAEFDESLIREAIIRELDRNGQVFFVHNRVMGINHMAEKIQQLVPEASVDIAHGQMHEEQLENVMLRFHNGECNVLVCTVIIESGLDMPNVNTLIVNHADRFGLTQLYQLRGRIGRGSDIAYAYFLYDKKQRLSAIAEQRLKTIYEATELGAGYGIAMKDLEIRGAGNLLGTRQSGNISAVGFSLYTDLLAQAVEEQKSKTDNIQKEAEVIKKPEPAIDLPLNSYIPESYIKSTGMRLNMYKRIAILDNQDQVIELQSEMIDRFGILPAEVEDLLFYVKVKLKSKSAGVESITTNSNIITLRLLPGLKIYHDGIKALNIYGTKIGHAQVIIDTIKTGSKWKNILLSILDLLRKI
jgi:transcription-repair coupling factor (superfamily II helicase)